MFIMLMVSKRKFGNAFEGLSSSQMSSLSQMAGSQKWFRATKLNKSSFRIRNNASGGVNSKAPLSVQVKQIRSQLNKNAPEMKYKDVVVGANNVLDPGALQLVTNIDQGDTVSTRTGDVVNLRSIHLKGYIITPTTSSALAGNVFYRFALIQDLQQVSSTPPAIGDIFAPLDPVELYPSVQDLGRFKIHWVSKVFDARMIAASAIAGDPQIVPTQSRHFEYNWTGAVRVSFATNTGTDIDKNGFYFVMIHSDTTDTVDIVASARCGFTDP